MARGSRTRVTRAPVLVTERGAPPHLLPVLLGVVVVSVVEGEAELLSQSGHVYINNCFPCKPSPAACSDSMARLVWEYTLTELETKLGPSWDKL